MGFLDVLLGRTKPVAPNLDVLFAIPPAALTVRAALGFRPTGTGAVCFKAAEGAAAEQTQDEMLALLHLDPDTTVTISGDEYGFTWVTCHRADHDLPALMTQLHAVNATLADAGFGSTLLCTVIGFAGPASRRLGLVYLFKRGTVYPFAPTDGTHRDTALELQARAALTGDLPIEAEVERWFPIWGAPALEGDQRRP